MKIWLNGRIADAQGAIDARDRGVTLGDGVFETLAVLGGAPLRMPRHVARMTSGASKLGLPVPYSADELAAAIATLSAENGVTEGAARITLLRGPAPRGVLPPPSPAPTVMISIAAGVLGDGAPVRVIVSEATRRNEHSPLAAIKSTNYLDAIVAAREAAAAGADDAILLNTCGRVAEATAANVFCRLDGELVTPPVRDGALPGVMRACVIEAAPTVERSLGVDDLMRADEIFLTSSLSIRPVVTVNGAGVGDARPGPAWARLKDLPRRAG